MTIAPKTDAPKPDDEDEYRPPPEAVQRMRDFLATLPPPPTLEELARQQGKTLPLPTFAELWEQAGEVDWGDAWDGFDEWLEAERRGEDTSRWIIHTPPDDDSPDDES